MESIATTSYLPALAAPHERERVARELEAVVHDLVALSLIGKQVHWAVFGPAFLSIHLQLDELVGSWRDLADLVAERALALGQVPDGQAEAVGAGSPVRPVARGPVADHTAVRELTRRVAEVAERARARLEPVGAVDLVSQDVLVDVVRALEKQQWMLRAQLGDT